jgi:hypothetical protein
MTCRLPNIRWVLHQARVSRSVPRACLKAFSLESFRAPSLLTTLISMLQSHMHALEAQLGDFHRRLEREESFR